MKIKFTILNVSLLTLFVFCFLTRLSAHPPAFAWAVGFLGKDVIGESIVVDNKGYVYSAGTMPGDTADFDPGPGIYNLTPTSYAGYVTKFDTLGNLIWARQVGTKVLLGTNMYTSNTSNSVAVDRYGNVYITGGFYGIVDFDPGPGTYNLTAVNKMDIYICKFDSGGNFKWAKSIGSTSDEQGLAITTDDAGNVYTTGVFSWTPDFDPGPGTYYMTSFNSGLSIDAFVSCLDSGGNFVWAAQMGGMGDDGGKAISVDASGNVYTTGYFQGTADFDPGVAVHSLSTTFTSNYYSAFISKLDRFGNYTWAKALTGVVNPLITTASANALTTDVSGNVYISGGFKGVIDFDPGIGSYNLTSTGYAENAYISKLNDAGDFVWTKKLGNGGDGSQGAGIALDILGNVYTTGYFSDSTNFNVAGTPVNMFSNGDYDAFIYKLDANGNYIWANQTGGTQRDYGNSIAISKTGAIYTTGMFTGSVDFDPGTGFVLLPNGGAYMQKLGFPCSNTTSILTQTACDSLVLNGITYKNSGTYRQIRPNAIGCDSTITLNLTIYIVDASVTQNAALLTANSANANYQWIDCDKGGEPIIGATNQSYTATTNGHYAAVITQNGCSDTSVCLPVTTLGIADVNMQNAVSIYPNPVSGSVNISFNGKVYNATIRLVNMTGQVVMQQNNFTGTAFSFNMTSYAPGIYMVEVTGSLNGVVRVKLVKQ